MDNKLELQQTVLCKNADTRWLPGVVTQILEEGRLLIQVSGWPMSLEFDEVKLPGGEQLRITDELEEEASSSLMIITPPRSPCSRRTQRRQSHHHRRRRRTHHHRGGYRPFHTDQKHRRSRRRRAPHRGAAQPIQTPAPWKQTRHYPLSLVHNGVSSPDVVVPTRTHAYYPPTSVFQPVETTKETSAHVFKTSEALEVAGCCDCVRLMGDSDLVYSDAGCPLCGIMETPTTKKELRAMHQQILRKPWRAPHKRNRNKLFWSALAYKKRDKEQKRARNLDRKFKAFRQNRTTTDIPERHTYVLSG